MRMSDEIIDTEATEITETEEQTQLTPDEVWEQVLSPETEVVTRVWICSYSFPVNVDSEGKPLPEGETGVAGETFAATSKGSALARLFNVITSVDEDVTGYKIDVDQEKPQWQIEAVKQFFTRDDVNLNLSVVNLI